MVDFRIVVQVDASKATQGSRQVEQGLNRVSQSADRVRTLIGRAFAALGGIFAVRQVVGFADSFTTLQNQIRVAVGETGDLADATERLFEISNRTRTSIEANVQLYQRLSFAAGELGAKQEELFQFVETVGQALAIQGGSASAASGALLQLSQAVGSGIVRAEEFNSILEGAFPIALAAAKGIDAAGGSVAKLRSLIIEGKITSDVFFKGLLSQSETFAETFARTTPTIGQAFTVLRNNLIKSIGELDKAQGVTASFARGILALGNNIDVLVRSVIAVGAALAVAFTPRLVTIILGAARAALTLVASLGPIGIIAVGLTALAIAAQELTGALFETNGIAVTLGDVATATFTVMSQFLSEIADTVANAVIPVFAAFGNEIGGIRGVLATTFNFLVSTIDNILGLFIGLGRAIGVSLRGAFEDFPTFLEAIFITAFNNALTIAEVGVNAMVSLLNNLPGVNIGEVAFEDFKIRGESAAVELSDRIIGAFKSGFDVNPLEGLITRIEEESVAVAKLRIETEKQKKSLDDANASRRKAIELTKEQTTALEGLIDRLDPAGAITRQFAKDQELLQKAFQAGVVSQEQLLSLQEQLLRERVKAEKDLRLALLDDRTDFGAGIERGLIRINDMVNDVATQAEDLLTGAFDRVGDEITNLLTGAKTDFAGFFRDIGAQLVKLGVQRALAAGTSVIGGTGGAGGGFGGIFSSVLGGLFGAADGADFQIGGRGGTDQNLLSVNGAPVARVSRDEVVSVSPNSGGGSRTVNNFNFPAGTDVTGFRRSQSQLEARMEAANRRASRRNN